MNFFPKPSPQSLILRQTNEELESIIKDATEIKINNERTIKNLKRQKKDVENLIKQNAIFNGEESLQLINKNIKFFEEENLDINDQYLADQIAVLTSRTGDYDEAKKLLIGVDREKTRLKRIIDFTENENIYPDNVPKLVMLYAKLNFENRLEKLVKNRIKTVQRPWSDDPKWPYDADDGLGGGRRSKRKSSKRKSSTRRKTAKRKSSKKTRK